VYKLYKLVVAYSSATSFTNVQPAEPLNSMLTACRSRNTVGMCRFLILQI